MLQPYAIWTVSDVRVWFSTWTDSDPIIEFLINAVSASIERYCLDKFVARAETLILNGNDQLILDLDSTAVGPITEIREGDSGQAATGTIRDPVNFPYQLIPKRGHVFSLYKWKFGVQNVQVKVTTGYGPMASLPEDIRQAALQLIKGAHDGGFGLENIGISIQTERIGDYSKTLFTPPLLTDIPLSIGAVLNRYRRWALA